MKQLFQKQKLEGKYWGVFIINPENPADRYLLTSPLDKEIEADLFESEFNRIGGIIMSDR